MQTQLGRPTLFEAYCEAGTSSDTHWTASLSKIGMTRIKRETVLRAYDALMASVFSNSL